MPRKKQKKIQALKPASWWKRILSYTIDSLFLFSILVLFVTQIYGRDLVMLLDNITQHGATSLLEEANLSTDMISQFTQLSFEEQNFAYWIYIVQNKYSHSIFILSQILSILYFCLFWWSTGQTIGAKLLKIKVITPLQDRIPLLQLFIRVVSLKLVETAWGLPLIIMTNPILKQRIHDSLSNTVVVEELPDDIEQQLPLKDEEETKEVTDYMSQKED